MDMGNTFTTSKGKTRMNDRNQKRPNLTAEAAYENAHLVAQDLVQRIGELLLDLSAPCYGKHPINWGHVGDINEVNNRLSAVVAFLDGTKSKN